MHVCIYVYSVKKKDHKCRAFFLLWNESHWVAYLACLRFCFSILSFWLLTFLLPA